jgi:hypothetical protein
MMRRDKRKRIKFTNAWLRKQFEHLNYRFFGNRIPQTVKVEFANLTKERANGTWSLLEGMIRIDGPMKKVGELMILLILLHEMIHADLEYQGYKGYPCDAGHGMRFQGELVRLWNAGAYDGNL